LLRWLSGDIPRGGAGIALAFCPYICRLHHSWRRRGCSGDLVVASLEETQGLLSRFDCVYSGYITQGCPGGALEVAMSLRARCFFFPSHIVAPQWGPHPSQCRHFSQGIAGASERVAPVGATIQLYNRAPSGTHLAPCDSKGPVQCTIKIMPLSIPSPTWAQVSAPPTGWALLFFKLCPQFSYSPFLISQCHVHGHPVPRPWRRRASS